MVTATTGAVVTTLTVKAEEALEVLPAASVALAVMLWSPSAKSRSMVQVVSAEVSAEPALEAPSYNCKLAASSLVPVKVNPVV